MNARDCISRAEALRSERSNLDGFYNLIDTYVVPGKGRIYEGRQGENSVDWSRREIYDSTALFAAQTLAASINGTLTSASTRWFSYRFRNTALNKTQPAMDWLQDCQERVFFALYESNFSVEASEYYLDAVSFGTPAMAHDYEVIGANDVKMIFKTLATRDFYFEEDVNGNPIGLYQFKEYTPVQIIMEFENVPEIVQKAYENPDNLEKFEVVHAIYLDKKAAKEYKKADPGKRTAVENRPYKEKFVCVNGAEDLKPKEARGYYEMNAYVLRWGRTAGSKFGYSPALNALPDIMTLNKLVEYDLRAREKAIDPPLLTQSRGVIGDIDLAPGGVTNVRDVTMIQTLESRARFDVSESGMGRLINSIRTAFFVDQLELKESPAMTATEVNVRYELMQRLLGPTLARFKSDFLDPMLKRSFSIMLREGAFEDPPGEVSEADLDIEYVGPMARNQKLDDVVAIERIVQALQSIGPMSPESLDVFNWPETMRVMAERLGVPADSMYDKQTVKRKENERKATEAKAMQAQQAGEMASAMRDGAAGAKDLKAAGMDLGGMV